MGFGNKLPGNVEPNLKWFGAISLLTPNPNWFGNKRLVVPNPLNTKKQGRSKKENLPC